MPIYYVFVCVGNTLLVADNLLWIPFAGSVVSSICLKTKFDLQTNNKLYNHDNMHNEDDMIDGVNREEKKAIEMKKVCCHLLCSCQNEF